MDKTPIYATLFYSVRKELDINWIEYAYLDMVYHLSHDGWCYKSLTNIGDDLGIDKSNVFRMRNKLIAKGLIKKNIKGHVKTTLRYSEHINVSKNRSQNATNRSQNAYASVVKTHTKNNSRYTENKGNEKIGGIKYKTPAELGMPNLT